MTVGILGKFISIHELLNVSSLFNKIMFIKTNHLNLHEC